MSPETNCARQRYQHRRRDTTGRFTANNSNLAVPLYVRLRPEVAAALRRLISASGEGVSFIVDTILAQELRVGSSDAAAKRQDSTPVFNSQATSGAQIANEDAADATRTVVVEGASIAVPPSDGATPLNGLEATSEANFRPSGGHPLCSYCHQRHGRFQTCVR